MLLLNNPFKLLTPSQHQFPGEDYILYQKMYKKGYLYVDRWKWIQRLWIFVAHINTHQKAPTIEEALNNLDKMNWLVK